MERKKNIILILILGLLSAVGPFSIDMYLPGFPSIADDLHTSIGTISYSLSSFFIGICLGQIICGPLLDRYGRKKPLCIGLLIYIAASIGCAFANSAGMLIIFRFFQALGGCVGMVAPRAIVRDVYPVDQNARIFSLLILILGVSPIIAPTTGSFVVTEFGWHYVFVILAVLTAMLLAAVIFYLPESRQPDPTISLRLRPILGGFGIVLRNPQFYTYSLAAGIGSAALFAYISGSPFVLMKLYSITQQQYGWLFSFIAVGLIGSSQVNNIMLRKYSSAQIVMTTLIIQAIAGVFLLAGTYFNLLNLTGMIALIFLFLSCQGFNFPNSSALSMAPFTRLAGSASALMGALQMGLGALASALVGLLSDGTALPMAGVMSACSFLALAMIIIGKSRIKAYEVQNNGLVKEQTLDMIEKY